MLHHVNQANFIIDVAVVIAKSRQREVDTVGQTGAVDEDIAEIALSVHVDEPLQVGHEELLLPMGIANVFEQLGHLRTRQVSLREQMLGDACLEPLLGVAITQPTRDVKAHHGFE